MLGGYPSDFTERFLQQARLLNKASDVERAYWRHVFGLARALGKLLHTAREYLDSARLSSPVDIVTIRLWEQGLMLPNEILGGEVTATVRWYVDAIRQQRPVASPSRLSTDALSLLNELAALSHDDLEWQ